MSCKVHPLFVCNSFPNSTIFEPWSISRAAWSFKVNKIMLLLPTTFFTGSLEPSGQLVPCLPWRYLGSLRSALCWPPISPSLLVTVMYSAINHVYNFSISPKLVTESPLSTTPFLLSIYPSYHFTIHSPSLISSVHFGIFSSSVFPSGNFLR